MSKDMFSYLALVLLVSYLAYKELYTRLKARSDTKASQLEEAKKRDDLVIAAQLKLVEELSKASQAGIDSTKLLAGTLKACEKIAEATVTLRDEIATFGKLVGNPKSEKGYPEDNFTPPASDEESNRAATFIDALQRGVPVDQAIQEARDADEKKTMLSAVSYGPEN